MTRHVFGTMGTVVSLVVDDGAAPEVLREVEAVFAAFDERFSLYRPSSELSRIADGRLALTYASAPLLDAYEQAVRWRALTGDAFTPHRPDGVVDLTGIVKALAIAEAGSVLDRAGAVRWNLNCGGDILLRQGADDTTVAGIVDPYHPDRLLTAVEIAGTRRSIATSGVAERGEHIWGRRDAFDQVTVVADDIVAADVLATAILAGGTGTCDDVTASMDVDVLAVRRDGGVVATPGVRLARSAVH